MRTIDATKLLIKEDYRKRHVYKRSELGELFGLEGRALTDVLSRLVKEGILDNVYRGIYVYRLTAHWGPWTQHQVATLLQEGETIYESGISSASAWGLVSQIPQSLTCVTSGKSDKYRTQYGFIEFFHSDTAKEDVEYNTIDRSEFDELPLADRMLTYKDTRRFNICVELMQEQFNKDMGGMDGTIRYGTIEDDDTWDFLDPVDNIEDIEFLSQKPHRW